MKLFIHAGTEKTGTTSIQTFLRSNQMKLRRRGIFIPNSLEHGTTGNHRRLVALVANEDADDDFYAEVDILDLDKRRSKIDVWRSEFDKEFSAARDCRVAIITSEHLHSRLKNKNEIEKLKQFLELKFDSVSVIFYLRDPLDTMLASVSTIVKAGGPLIEIPNPKNSGWRFLIDHKNTIELWESVFGSGIIIPRLFIKGELKYENVVADFAEVCNLDIEGLELPSTGNESLSWIGMQILAKVNQSFPRILPQGGLNPARGKLTDAFSDYFTTGPRLRPSKEIRELYKSEFFESNEWVRNKFFPYKDYLFPDKPELASEASALSERDLHDLCNFITNLWINRK